MWGKMVLKVKKMVPKNAEYTYGETNTDLKEKINHTNMRVMKNVYDDPPLIS